MTDDREGVARAKRRHRVATARFPLSPAQIVFEEPLMRTLLLVAFRPESREAEKAPRLDHTHEFHHIEGLGIATPSRFLVVCSINPYAMGGLGERIRLVLRALSRLGEVDVISVVHGCIGRVSGAEESVAVTSVPLLARSVSPFDYLSLLAGWKPRRLSALRSTAQRQVLLGAMRSPYALVWAVGDRAFLALPELAFTSPVVTDLVDFEGNRDVQLATAVIGRYRHVRLARAKLERRALRNTLRRISSRSSRTLVSSPVDRESLGMAGVDILPNGYWRQSAPPDDAPETAHPVLLAAATFGYKPNWDGVHWLVKCIWPEIRAKQPTAELRLVGSGLGPDEFQGVEGVTVVGPVPSMTSELSLASIALVPLRVGSGTRVKILEAWANRIPVVSTTVGAEGLDAVDGTHLLLADNPADFANAVERLLSDGNLRADIIDEGERRFEGRHSSHVLEQSVCKLVSELVVK